MGAYRDQPALAGEEFAGGDGALASVVAGNVIAFVVALPMALPVQGARPADWGLVVYLGVFQIGLAYLLLSRAVRYLPAFEATTLLLLDPYAIPCGPGWSAGNGPEPGRWRAAR